MKKNFLKRLGILSAVVAAAVFLNSYFLNNLFQNLFYKSVNRIGVFLTDKLLKNSVYSRGFLGVKGIIDDNAHLKEENQSLLGKVAELDGLKRENDFLRGELGVSRKSGAQLLFVKIFSIQKNSLSSAILINRGSRDGIKRSMAVVTSGNILVGVVDQVFENTSQILVSDDPRTKISARVESSGVLVSTRGELGGSLGVDLVANGDEIGEGDVLISSGLDGLPESLPIAKVAKVETGGGLFKKVKAKMIFDPSLGSGLFVILQ